MHGLVRRFFINSRKMIRLMIKQSKIRTAIWATCAMVAGVFIATLLVEAPSAVRAFARNMTQEKIVYVGVLPEYEEQSFSRRAYDHVASFFIKERTEPPAVAARRYLIGDVVTGEIIAEQDADEVVPIASITKLFTALTAQRVYRPGTHVRVSKQALATEGASGGFVQGERFTIDELLDPLLLESSNDAAEVIAEGYNRARFIQELNTFSSQLNLTDTHFDDPSGLSPNNTSSARDLFTFAQYLYHYEAQLIERTLPKQVELTRSSRNSYHLWRNRNSFVTYGDEWYRGGKIGYIPEAAQTMLAFFTVREGALDERTYVVVVLGSGSRNRDVATLIDYATNNAWSTSSVAATALLGRAATKRDEGVVDTTSLLFVGDIMLDRGVGRVIKKSAAGDFNYAFAHADFLSRADITFGNLEGPASDRGYDLQNLYSFRMDPAALGAIKDAGFDVLSVANNHMGDWGRSAFEDTLERIRGLGMRYVGSGVNRNDAVRPRVITKNGVSFGYVAFSDVGPTWLAGPSDASLMLQASDSEHNEIISRAAEEVDVLVVSYHFGNEYEKEPSTRQRELAMHAIDSGATVVIGHHPHVIQPIERYGEGIIAYSLGNFVFDQDFSQETMRGLVLEIVFEDTSIVRVTPREVALNGHFQPALIE